MTALIAAEWGLPDRAALGWFLLAWLGYGPLIQHLRSPGSITARLRGIRRAWMRAMLDRDNRITDASLIGHPMHSATFFASTTMIALVALLGMLGELCVRTYYESQKKHPYSIRTLLNFDARQNAPAPTQEVEPQHESADEQKRAA